MRHAARIDAPGASNRIIAGTVERRKIIEPTHKLKIDQKKLQNCKSNILNLVNVL